MLSIKEFHVLRFFCEAGQPVNQRMAAASTGYSLGSVNSIISRLIHSGYLDEQYQVTASGFEVMAPYKVHNAIILAAGMSTRFVPFSYERPKGLTVVKGEVLVERQIRQLKEAGISEIILVLGHMMEKFFYLIDKYDVKAVVNNEYRHKNTHSSVYFARDYLKNTYICCADNYFPQSVFHQYEYHALYSTLYMEGIQRGERGVTTNSKGLIIATQRPAVNQWVMNGYAYFDTEFSSKFKTILEDMYDTPGTDGLYWEQVYAEHVSELHLYEKRYTDQQVLEFDSVAELEKFDPNYIKYNDIALTRNICSTLGCSPADIHEIQPINKGYTNRSFKFSCNGESYVYRSPGVISSEWLDRRSEKKALQIAKKLGIDDSYIYANAEEGWKISHFVAATESFDFSNPEHLARLCKLLRPLYENPHSCGRLWDYIYESKQLLEKLNAMDQETYQAASQHLHDIEAIDRSLKADNWPIQLTHNDIYEDNLLVSGDKLYLIDWEYAGDTDIGYDLCKLIVKNDATGSDIDKWLAIYFKRTPTPEEHRHIVGCAAVYFYYWYIWALYMVRRGNDVSDLVLKYLNTFRLYQQEFGK